MDMKITTEIKVTILIVTTLIVPFFIDQVNGYLQNVKDITISISQMYKVPLLLFMLGYIYTVSKKEEKYTLLISLFLFSSLTGTFFSMFDTKFEVSWFFDNFGHTLKYLTFPIAFLFFKTWLSRQKVILNVSAIISKTVYFLWIFTLLGIAGTYIGFGIPMYGINADNSIIGSRGYFIAGNEVSNFYLIILAPVVVNAFSQWNFFRSSITIFVGLLGGIMIGTKTSGVGSLLVIMMTYLLVRIYNRDLLKLKRREVSLLGSFFVFVLLIIQLFPYLNKFFIEPILRRLTYFSQKKEGLEFLTSGRTSRLNYTFNEYLPEQNLVYLLFGEGKGKDLAYPIYVNGNIIPYAGVEIDIVDMLIQFGILGSFLIYGFIYLLLKNTFLLFKKRKTVKVVSLVVIITIYIIGSIGGGHILYATLSGLVSGFVFACIFYEKDINYQ